MTSIAYTSGDPVALAKALSKYVDDNPEFHFKAGVVEGRVISMKEIKALATMPSKEEIYSKLLFLINAPAQRLVTVMNAVGRDLAWLSTRAWRRRSSRTRAERLRKQFRQKPAARRSERLKSFSGDVVRPSDMGLSLTEPATWR